MLNRIIQFSLRNRLAVMVVALIIVVFGCWTASRMDVDVFPDLNAPTVVIMTEAPGMAPEEVERLISFPLEAAMNGSPGVQRVRSESSPGYSIVRVEFDWDTDPFKARQTVSERLTAAAEALPKGAGSPVMAPQSSILGEMIFVGMTARETTPLQLRSLADGVVQRSLLSLPGVAQVSVIGGDAKEYAVALDISRMAALGVSLTDVREALGDFNLNSPGGVLYDYGNEYLVRGNTSTGSVEELAATPVAVSDGRTLKLEDVAEIKVAPSTPATGTASVNNTPGVIITVTKQPGASTETLTEKVEETMENLKSTLPADITVNTHLYRQQTFIDASINNIQKALIEGAIFVAIILFVFLMNPRTTLISLVTIPLSLIITLITLKWMGLTINTMSIGGIAIAIGSLVDDAIVDVENVYKRLRENREKPEGKRRKAIDVIFDASREVRMPIINSTMIIIVSFVPLLFLNGIGGRMLVPLGIAFIVSLLASTLVALTLTPVLCSYLLPKPKGLRQEPVVTRKLKGWYHDLLLAALRRKRVILWSAVALFAAAAGLAFTFGRSFLPPFNEGSFTINISGMPGISLEESDKLGARAEALIKQVPEVKNVARKTGRAELDEHALGVNVSEIEVPFELDGRSKIEVAEDIRHRLEQIPGINVEIGQPITHRIDAMLSGTEASVAIKVFGTDLNRMHRIGTEIKEAISGIDGLRDINVEQQVERPQLVIKPRREVMAAHGITMPAFNDALRVILAGETVSQVYEGDNVYDIVLRVADDSRSSLERIGELTLTAPDGRSVPLDYIAEITSTSGPNTINRENISRRLVVSANIEGRDQRSAVEEIKKAVAEKIDLPQDYRIEYGGQFESEEEASRTLLLASLFSIIAIYLLLYNQFRSAKLSLVVMINLPLALIGGVVAIALSSRVISVPAIIGFISLFGIATRNGMLLVDRYNELRKEGLNTDSAILRGSVDRLNPILMTALTSALALIPLAAGGALPGNEIQSPMAKVILGGLVSATFLNLFVIPVVYKVMMRRSS